MPFMVERKGQTDVSKIVEIAGKNPVVRLHLASYFRMQKTGDEIRKILSSHGLDFAYDPVRITPEIEEELWEDHSTDPDGFFTFLPKRLILGHTLESIKVPANMGLLMREFFYLEETGEILPLTTNCSAPGIHPGSCGPQTYEIINTSDKPLSLRVSDLICYLDVDYLNDPSVLAQQNFPKGEFGNQSPGKIKLGNKGADWEIKAIREALGLS